jgi:hypothetical protein
MTLCSSWTASWCGRWNELRPMMVPKPPPSAVCRFSSSTAAVSLAAPPEKMTIRWPSKADCTTCLTRSASVSSGTPAFSSAARAASLSMWWVGGFTLTTWAPSWQARWAAYATTSTAVRPSVETPEPRG